MSLSSQQFVIDNRLLAIEELLRQRKYPAAQRECDLLDEAVFSESELELGLFLSLKADCLFSVATYRTAIEYGLRGAKLLADFPVNKRFGRIQLVLSKAYSALGDLKNAEIRARDALASYRRGGDREGQIDALNEAARVAFIRCDYHAANDSLADAIGMIDDNPRKHAQLTGNLGRIRLLLGQWNQAETDLNAALAYNQQHNEEISEALNLLSLAYLQLRRREFVPSARLLEKANALITRLDLKRERVIYLEYAGELALERGDIVRAKHLLHDAYQAGRLLAPESALVTQSSRRLAEADLALDNHDEAMKYAQKGLDLSLQLGEKGEVAMTRVVIARVFAARREFTEAVEHIRAAVELARQVGDPFDLARSLLVLAEIKMASDSDELEIIRSSLDEAARIFKKLRLEYWQAETDFRSGMFACQRGDLSRGFRKISRAEKLFMALDDRPKVRAVSQFLHSLTDQAVALAVSDENEFKVFSNLISKPEVQDLKTIQIDDVLKALIRKTNANRALIYCPDFDSSPIVASWQLTPQQIKKFVDSFQPLLGQEISQVRPTLLLDCRRDPYLNGLFPDTPEAIASMIVVPFTMADQCTRYLYIDKLSVDSMLNPFSQAELNFAVGYTDLIAFKSAELQKMKLMEDNRRLRAQLMEKAAFPNIISQSTKMLEMLAQLRQVIDSPISITIEGETGTGKDLLARAIHYNSVRRNKRFISVNCAALPETLLESELFGFKRGAFTGADRDKPGLFEEADGGTFFLDEVADMPLSIQAKVLRVLECKELIRLGETVPRKADVRIISATNKDLKEQMAKGLFRQDLYYRLSALSYLLSPLRERKEDVPLLINHFLEESHKRVTPDTMKALAAYDWPGNVRELENEIKKLVLLTGDNDEIGIELLSVKISGRQPGASAVAVPAGNGNGHADGEGVSFDAAYSLYDYLAFWEKKFIVKALREQRGIKKHAAAALNIPESTLRLKIKQYNIDLGHLEAIS